MKGKGDIEKERILEAAVDMFSEKGYAATSIRDISTKLNISIATLYYYFKNKEDLLFTIIEAMGEKLLHTLGDARKGCEDEQECLRRMFMGQIRLTENDNKRAKIFVEEQHNLSKKYWNIIYKQHRMIYDLYIEQLKILEKKGIISGVPLPVTAFAMFGMSNWCYRWFRKDGGLSIDDVGKKLVEILFYGIIDPEQRPYKNKKDK